MVTGNDLFEELLSLFEIRVGLVLAKGNNGATGENGGKKRVGTISSDDDLGLGGGLFKSFKESVLGRESEILGFDDEMALSGVFFRYKGDVLLELANGFDGD